MIELTASQHDELQKCRAARVIMRDPSDHQEYVLIPASIFDRLAPLVDAAEDEAVREAWLQLSEKETEAWIRSNPY